MLRCRSVGVFFFQAEDGIRDLVRSRGLGDVYKRQIQNGYNGLSLLVALNFDRIVMAVAIIVGLVGGAAGSFKQLAPAPRGLAYSLGGPVSFNKKNMLTSR